MGTLLPLGILLSVLIVPLWGDPLRLGAPVILPNRAVELNLTGQTGASYSVEASLNFTNWFLVSSGIATNGLLSVRHDTATNYSMLFYRAKGTNASLPPLTVGLTPDTNHSVSTLISLDGGSGVLYGPDGTRFTLSLPTNSTPDPQILRMTLVTNITGLPFARGTLGAILLEPTNLVFWGAASLEITFSTNTDRREVVSFFSHGDGSSFQLTPDRVGANRVIIPVLRSGVFGSSLATGQELANAARIQLNSGQPASLALASKISGIDRRKSSTTECFPEKESAANQAKTQIDAAWEAKSKEIAALLGTEREKQLRNESDDSASVLAQVSTESCTFYTTYIAPRWAEAAENCALGAVLIVKTLGLERQRELLGATDDCTSLSNIPFCAIFKSCLQDTRDCCALGKKGSDKVAEVLGLQRQDQLLGSDCISQTEAQEVIDLCSSNSWSGDFSMVQTGSTNGTSTGEAGLVTTISEFTSHFDGAVEESEEFGDPAMGTSVDLRVSGQLTERTFKKTTIERSAPCQIGGPSKTLILEQLEQVVADQTTYHISFITLPGTYLLFQAINIDGTNDPAMGPTTLIDYQEETRCDDSLTIVKDFNQTKVGPTLGGSLTDYSGDLVDPNVVSGTHAFDDPTLDPPRHLEFKWNFTRRVVPP